MSAEGTPMVSQLTAVAPDRLRFCATIFGQSVVLEAPFEIIRPFAERYFAIAEQLLAHNIDIANRTIDHQAQLAMATAMRATGDAQH